MRNLRKILFVVLVVFVSDNFFSQNITASNYSACPNQLVNGCVTWNNVANATYTLILPAGGSSPQTNMGSNNCFTFSHPGPGNGITTAYNFTIAGNGIYLGNPITSTVIINLSIAQPSPLLKDL